MVPTLYLLKKYKISYHLLKEQMFILGYTIIEDFDIGCFIAKEFNLCMGSIVELQYSDYLKYQRIINVSQYDEKIVGDFIFFQINKRYVCPPLMNKLLEEMILLRQSEWAVIPDVFVSIPVQYNSKELILKRDVGYDVKTKKLLKDLDFRTHYEAGVPSNLKSVDDLANFKNRIQRFYLGKIRILITSEITIEHYGEFGNPIGTPAFVDIYISIDKDSNCAVFTWYSLSSPFLISHLMDNIIRNNLIVVKDENINVNFFDYLHTEFDVIKRGTPKIFAVIPEDRKCLKSSQIASLLASETIYPEGEFFGEIVDPEITTAVNSEKGMGQYDRAFVCAYSNVVLQFSPDFYGTLYDRLCEESITLFYIELILLEEASIHIADKKIINLITSSLITEPVNFLKHVENIYDDYSKTIDFWDIQVNYPTSQKSIDMLRKTFKINEQLKFMQRNQEQLQLVFDTKCDIIDRNDSKRMDTSLAIISVLAVFSAWIDGYDYIATWEDVFTHETIHILQRILFVLIFFTAGYAISHLFGNKFGLFLSLRREKRRRKLKRKRNR